MIHAQLVNVDFELETIEFSYEGDITVRAGHYAIVPLAEMEHRLASLHEIGERVGCPPCVDTIEWIVERVHLAARLEEKANG